ncbi:MAG: hypothetical protein HOO96_22625 [Polyangiaceae bacterium]|nr:hypothetical protein [Polyangiaceae bacterium]
MSAAASARDLPCAAPPGNDARDWPTAGGFFVPRPFVLDHDFPPLRAARHAAAALHAAFPEIVSVHVCGSVLEVGVTPADVDLAVVVADGAASLPPVAEVLATCDTGLEDRVKARAWDVLVERRGTIMHNPLRCMPLLFRSLRVAGPAPWRGTPKIAADAATAAKLFGPRKRELIGSLAALRDAKSERRPEMAAWLAKVQKRALRLGMLEALATVGAYSAVPARCAELLAMARPELAHLAIEVSEDLRCGYAEEATFGRLVALAHALLTPRSGEVRVS